MTSRVASIAQDLPLFVFYALTLLLLSPLVSILEQVPPFLEPPPAEMLLAEFPEPMPMWKVVSVSPQQPERAVLNGILLVDPTA